MSGPLAITAFVACIVAAIMLHELGHFLTARRFGMRADRFFLGFGPTLWSVRRGETTYGVKALPLGGFVRILGMSPLDEREPPLLDALMTPARTWLPVTGEGGTDAGAVARVAAPGTAAEPPSLDRTALLERLAALLRERGTPAPLVARILRRAEDGLDPAYEAGAVRGVLHEILVTEVADTGRVGDLRHRLLRGDDGRFFHDRPRWQRAIVLVSGSLTHFALAVAILFGAYATLPHWTGELDPRVAHVETGSPAAEAGLRPGDVVVAVEGVRSDDYLALRDEIRARPGAPTRLVVRRDGAEIAVTLVPEAVESADGETIGRIGFAPDLRMQRFGVSGALRHALVGEPGPGLPGGFVPMLTGSVEALTRVFSPSGIADLVAQATGQRDRADDGAVSLVGAASLAGQVSGGFMGLMLFLGLVAVVNVFIGIFNLVPLPPLDGGHLAVVGVEGLVNGARRLRGKVPDYQVDPRALAVIAVPVLAILAVVVVALLWLDITDPIRLG